jgi:ABC-type branched-subunit amino acid transport system substrate-binding protein
VVGALSSGVTIPVATSVTSVNGIPQISSASTSPVITTLADNDFLFRSVPSDALQGVVLASVVEETGYTKVGVLYVNNDYGRGLAETFEASFSGQVATLPYEPGQASYRGELREASEGGGEALVLIGYPENGITILRQALEEGYFENFVFTDGMKAPEIIEAIGDSLNGSIGTTPQAVADSDGATKFTELYEARFGELPPKPFIDSAYDAAMMAALAMEKAGSDDPTAIRDALREIANPPGTQILPGEFAKAKELIAAGEDIDYVGAAGSQNFDENGDVSGTFAFWGIENGEIVTHRIVEP